jgi:hypothetical protein
MSRRAAAFILAIAGCAGSDPEPCKPLVGTYLTEFRERSGDCGAMDARVDRLDDEPTADPPGCEVTGEDSDDGCHHEYEIVCVREVAPADEARGLPAVVQEYSETGSIDQMGDESAEATLGVRIRDADTGALLCSSVYDATITKQ